MKYTKYFSGQLKYNGVPNLSAEQFKRYMNIVSLESTIEACTKVVNLSREIVDLKYNSTVQLHKLTDDQSPEDLYSEMIRKSIE